MVKTKLYIATTNIEKATDLSNILEVYTAGIELDIRFLPKKDNPPEETGVTLAENALAKAKYYSELLGATCIAEDSGSYVDALDGEPGIYPRRWSESTNELFPDKVLRLIGYTKDRGCTVKSAIALANPHYVGFVGTGSLKGTLTDHNYDPGKESPTGIFIPDGSNKPLCMMSPKDKLLPKYSARVKAWLALMHLNQNILNELLLTSN